MPMAIERKIWRNHGGKERITLSRKGQVRHLYGLFFADKEKEFTIDIDAWHLAEGTESLIVLRGLVMNAAAVKIHGNVYIKKGAKGTKTRFEAKALLLSDKAKCEIIPALEIDENEVRASHSTYVGRLDDEELFYLRSRGITEDKARQMLIEAFLWPVTSQMKNVKGKT